MSLEKRVKRRVTGREHSFFAVVLPGFEGAALKELAALGIKGEPAVERGGVLFTGKITDCWAVNLMARSVARVLMRLFEFRARDFFSVYEKTGKFEWELYIKEGSELEVRASASSSRLYHTERIKLEAEKGISRALGGRASFEKGDAPGQKVFLRIFEDICTVSIDTSGDHLYRRGYKTGTVAASIRETTAASILIEAGIEDYDCIIDPMCGSGTFAVEAASLFTKKPAAGDRVFPFETWPSFSEKGFAHLKTRLFDEHRPALLSVKKIICFDIDAGRVSAAEKNIAAAGFSDAVSITEGDFFSGDKVILPLKKTLVVMNPPYGTRLGLADRTGFYKKINNTLKNKYKGCAAAVIVPEECVKPGGFKYARKILFSNGGIRVALLLSPSSV